jgi:hypothetical protein
MPLISFFADAIALPLLAFLRCFSICLLAFVSLRRHCHFTLTLPRCRLPRFAIVFAYAACERLPPLTFRFSRFILPLPADIACRRRRFAFITLTLMLFFSIFITRYGLFSIVLFSLCRFRLFILLAPFSADAIIDATPRHYFRY